MEIIEQTIQSLENFIEKKALLKRKHPLRYLFWEATLRCNLNCLHCGSDCFRNNNTRSEELESSLLKKTLTEISQHYDPNKITFAIIGGEPLLRQDIIGVGSFASNLGYRWGITTNGTLLDREMIDKLRKAGLQTISVSLDGLEKAHDQLRNSTGCYQRVTKGIRLLVETPFYKKFDIICCVSKLNINTLPAFIETLIEFRVPAVRFVPVFSRGRASRNSHLMLETDDYHFLLEFIAAIRKTSFQINISLGEEGYWGPEWECQVRDAFHYCGSGITIGTILYNGYVTGCPSVSRVFVQGSIKKQPFIDIWNEAFYPYREGKKELFSNKCQDCSHWDLCEGGGFHLLDQSQKSNVCNYKRIVQRKRVGGPYGNE
jgi:radical SAM protein with 4Fe4S-binding SPASM domain